MDRDRRRVSAGAIRQLGCVPIELFYDLELSPLHMLGCVSLSSERGFWRDGNVEIEGGNDIAFNWK